MSLSISPILVRTVQDFIPSAARKAPGRHHGVMDAPGTGPAEEREGPVMRVRHHLPGLARTGPDACLPLFGPPPTLRHGRDKRSGSQRSRTTVRFNPRWLLKARVRIKADNCPSKSLAGNGSCGQRYPDTSLSGFDRGTQETAEPIRALGEMAFRAAHHCCDADRRMADGTGRMADHRVPRHFVLLAGDPRRRRLPA